MKFPTSRIKRNGDCRDHQNIIYIVAIIYEFPTLT